MYPVQQPVEQRAQGVFANKQVFCRLRKAAWVARTDQHRFVFAEVRASIAGLKCPVSLDHPNLATLFRELVWEVRFSVLQKEGPTVYFS